MTWRRCEIEVEIENEIENEIEIEIEIESARDLAQARALSEGKARAYEGPGSGRIDDDVQLGYWMSQVRD